MNTALTIALIVVVLSVVGVVIALALERHHPEDAEREAFDKAAQERADVDGFSQPGTAKIDLGAWSNIVKPRKEP